MFAQPTGASAEAEAAAAAEDDDGVLLCTRLPCGDLTVRPLRERDVRGAALLLTRAFAGTPEAVTLEESTEFMLEQLGTPERGVTLAARLVPADPSLLPKNQSSRLVGTVGLAFDLEEASTRDGLERLASLPSGSCYLSNMAVDPKLRRRGVAREMLRACDAAAAAARAPGGGEITEVWLHVREVDDAARPLYEGFGYEEVERDKPPPAGGVFGFGFGGQAQQRRPRILMRRCIGGAGAQQDLAG